MHHTMWSTYFLPWTLAISLTTIYLSVIVLLVLFARAKPCPKKTFPPGPFPCPILGNLLILIISNTNQLHKLLAKLANTYGPIMTLKLGSLTTIIISSSTLAKHALVKHHAEFSSPSILSATRTLQHDQFSMALLPVHSTRWKFLRRLYSNILFSDKMLQSTQPRRYQKITELQIHLQRCLQDGISIDVGQQLRNAIFNVMFHMTFSLDLRDGRMKEIKDLTDCIIEEIGRPNIVDCYPFLDSIDPQNIKRRCTALCEKLFKLFDEIINLRVASRKELLNISASPNDLLDVIINAMEEHTSGKTREQIHHSLMDLLGSGVDTTAKTIEWAMAELLRNPMVLSKCQEEIDKVVGKCKSIQESDISKLKYLEAVVKETLRLHPPVSLLLPRKVEKDVEIGGFTIPEGSRILFNIWAINRDPSVWADPDLFNPERFLGSDPVVDVKGQHFGLLPFSTGKRICPGMPLALRMLPLMLAMLIGSFDWKIDGNLDMDDKFGITVKKATPLVAFPISRAARA